MLMTTIKVQKPGNIGTGEHIGTGEIVTGEHSFGEHIGTGEHRYRETYTRTLPLEIDPVMIRTGGPMQTLLCLWES